MTQYPRVWETYKQAKLWKRLPSDIVGIEDEWDAFCLNRAVWLFGSSLEQELDSINEKTNSATNRKRERILQKWLRLPRKFRSPVAGKGKLTEEVLEEAGIKIEGSTEAQLLGGVRREL